MSDVRVPIECRFCPRLEIGQDWVNNGYPKIYSNPFHILDNYFIDPLTKTALRLGLVIECGAGDGMTAPGILLGECLDWYYVGVEPNNDLYSELKKYRKKNQNALVNAALSNINGPAKFNLTANPFRGFLRAGKPQIEEILENEPKFPNGESFIEMDIFTITWKELISILRIKTVNLLVLDVEGHEISVIEGMVGATVLPDVIQIEFGYSDLDNLLLDTAKKENFSGFVKIGRILNDMGYLFDYVADNNAYFSKESFWDNRPRPISWIKEDEELFWYGYCYYRKSQCKPMVKY